MRCRLWNLNHHHIYLSGRGRGGKRKRRRKERERRQITQDAPCFSFIPSGYNRLQGSWGGRTEFIHGLLGVFPLVLRGAGFARALGSRAAELSGYFKHYLPFHSQLTDKKDLDSEPTPAVGS